MCFPPCFVRQNQHTKKNFFLRGDFRQFSNKNVHIWDYFFPLLFPKDSESLKILDIRLWEVGPKRRLNGTSKVNTHTDKQTDGQTHRRTFRLIESIGPEGPCFENVTPDMWHMTPDTWHLTRGLSRGRKSKNYPGSRFWWTKIFWMNNACFYKLIKKCVIVFYWQPFIKCLNLINIKKEQSVFFRGWHVQLKCLKL